MQLGLALRRLPLTRTNENAYGRSQELLCSLGDKCAIGYADSY